MPRFAFQPLFDDGELSVSRVACDGCDPERPSSEAVEQDQLVIVLRGRFQWRDRDGRKMIDPSTPVVFPKHREFTVSHPHAGGDVCLSIGGAPVPESGPHVSAEGFARLHALAARPPEDRLELDEILVRALSAETPRHGQNDVAAHLAHEIRLRFDQRLTLSGLARAAGVSVFHACRLFKAATGTTLHQFQLELRLRHALALLLDTDRPLAAVSAETGFASQSHFTTRFRRRFGVTPRTVRKTRCI